MTENPQHNQVLAGTEAYEALLLGSVKRGLQTRLGKEVGRQPPALTHINYHITNPIPEEAVRYLRLMLRGIHRPALHEWLVTVQQAGYQAQIEVIDILMRFLIAQWSTKSQWHQPIKWVLGAEGIAAARVIVAEGDFGVVEREFGSMALDRRVAQDSLFGHQARIDQVIEKLQRVTRLRTRMDPKLLQSIERVWPHDLTEMFFEHILAPVGARYVLQDIYTYVYFFALTIDEAALNQLAELLDEVSIKRPAQMQSNQALRWHQRQVEDLEAVMDFRRRVVRAITVGKQA